MTENTPPENPSASESDRRAEARGTERRRKGWHSFRTAYPTFLRFAAVLFLILVAGDIWLAYRRSQYNAEIDHLRAGMTDAERKKSDIVVASEQDKLRMALELAKRQARVDPHLHLAVAVDSGVMYLVRDGVTLRVMRVALAPARIPAPGATGKGKAAGDTSAATLPLGERTVQQVVSGAEPALVLNGDARIYAGSDSGAVAAGNVRANDADLQAILPNVSAGMPVYFY